MKLDLDFVTQLAAAEAQAVVDSGVLNDPFTDERQWVSMIVQQLGKNLTLPYTNMEAFSNALVKVAGIALVGAAHIRSVVRKG